MRTTPPKPQNPLQLIYWYVDVIYENKRLWLSSGYGRARPTRMLTEDVAELFSLGTSNPQVQDLLRFAPFSWWGADEGIRKSVIRILEERCDK